MTVGTAAAAWRTRLFKVGAWCFIVIGLAHLLVQLAALTGSPAPGVQRVFDAMSHTSTSLLLLGRSLTQLFYGFSVTMALSILGLGILDLVVVRQARQLVARGWAVPGTNLALASLGLAVSLLAFPEPPIAALAIATVAFAATLVIRPQAEPAAEPM